MQTHLKTQTLTLHCHVCIFIYWGQDDLNEKGIIRQNDNGESNPVSQRYLRPQERENPLTTAPPATHLPIISNFLHYNLNI